MHEGIRIHKLAADEFVELLTEHGADLTEEQAVALKLFIDECGDLESAMVAIEMLDSLNRAA